MAPYRNSRTGNARSTRTQIDHDVFEGLPVRHWRKKPINVTTAPEKENMNDMKARNLALPELEMPRDSHLLSEMSQNLLRAARMPQAKKSIIAPLMEDDKEPGEDEGGDGELDTGFIAKRWAVVPKDLEGPEPEFLAKRRKGLPSVHGGTMAALGSTQQMRKTKIRKLDTSGESSVLEVLVPEGQSVDGEIFEEETSPTQAPAPGTVVEGVGVVNAEGVVIAGDQGLPANNRRKPPLPKRKIKGPGRGKKKKVAFAGADGRPTSGETNNILDGAARLEGEPKTDDRQGMQGYDRTIGDESTLHEGEDGSEEGTEGEEGEEGDREEGELSASPSPHPSPPKASHIVPDETKVEHETALPNDLQSVPDAPIWSTIMDTTTTEPPIVPSIGPVIELSENLVAENTDQTLDRMRYDESLGEAPSDSVNVPTRELTTQPSAEPESKPVTDMFIDAVGQDANGLAEKPPAESESITKAFPEEATTETIGSSVEEQPNGITTPPLQGPRIEPIVDAIPEPEIQEPGEAKAETMPDTSGRPIQEPAAEFLPVSTLESITKPVVIAPPVPTVEVGPDPSFETDEKSAIEVTSEATADDFHYHHEKQIKENTPDPIPEALQEPAKHPTPPSTMETFPASEVPIMEGSVAAPIEEPPAPEPVIPKPAEVYYEPAAEPAERRFSFTRPTASPKAPTPSPPTPIQDNHSLRPWDFSPKAPTMSPPTPLERSMPSSPEIPLAEQQFALPPPIDTANIDSLAPIPGIQHFSSFNHITIEAAPKVEPQVNAQIPVDHDPLNGMAEPKIVHDSHGDTGADEQTMHFSDGEEDLLGSLERSLDQPSHC